MATVPIIAPATPNADVPAADKKLEPTVTLAVCKAARLTTELIPGNDAANPIEK
jgi:hypothetical protein